MLVLTRKLDEAIILGDGIEIRVVQVRGTGDNAVVRLGITAPRNVTVLRKEVYDEVVAANQAAADKGAVSTELLQVLLQQTKPSK
ncbi:MAG TPA: carbon storage regulator [Symbiobacteriaceae bacterium]|nr:carbon storage regulator [Symbiobacteriaceae bacterium]